MGSRHLKRFRYGALIGGIAVLVLAPIVLVSKWSLFVMLAIVAVFFPWSVVVLHNVAAGTRYQSWRSSSELMFLGVSNKHRYLFNLLVVFCVVASVFGHTLKWPAVWAAMFQNGILAGPAFAIFLFGAASIYQTSVWLVEHNVVKRCSDNHDFSPFEQSCPNCSASKKLELVINDEKT
jgi:hypothetical protein